MTAAQPEGTQGPTGTPNAWDQFWFRPAPMDRVAGIRSMLCLIVAAYFISCWSDATFWYTAGGPLAATRVSNFLQSAGLEDAARWIVSPLFLTDSAWMYHGYLLVGIGVAAMVTAGQGGRIAPWALWLLLVGWANRSMILSGLAETLLSLGLFASAIAPPGASWWRIWQGKNDAAPRYWAAGFSERLLAVQITLIGVATFITMLGGRIWFNGIGAYALAAPVEDRTIDWTATDSLLVQAVVHESLTHLMVLALPVGFLLAWLPRTHRVGLAILLGWCIAVALLGSHWLYACTFATMVLAIVPGTRGQT